jgi:hypothetical protein
MGGHERTGGRAMSKSAGTAGRHRVTCLQPGPCRDMLPRAMARRGNRTPGSCSENFRIFS